MKSSQSRSAGSGFFPALNFALPAVAQLLLASPARMQAGNDNRSPNVPAAIQVPGGTNKVHFHAYAVGVQIYVWTVNPTNAALSSWVFKAPEAVLFADAGTHGETGIHYAGPTWESQSGSKVVGTAIANAPSPNANSIPLLLIRAVSTERPGIFARTTYVQRVNTVGGRAPGTAGTAAGQVARVPYTAEYYFYREHEGGIEVSQSLPTPLLLSITRSGGNIILSWTVPSADWVLQQNSDLTTTNWTDVTDVPTLDLTKLRNEMFVSTTNASRFYRLKH